MTPSPLFPASLKKNDTIGIIAPAGQLKDKDRFNKGVTIIQQMGFQVKFARDLWPGSTYLADTDTNRAHEINEFYRDTDIKAIVAVRGGYGCLRILDKLDLNLITQNPKMLIGFSDITILQNYLFDKLGRISFHGPVVTSLPILDEKSLHSFHKCLSGNWRAEVAAIDIEILRDGPTSSGPIVGGNLSSLVTLLGTEYDFSWEGKIVLLEDINEPLYKIDRMFTQLHLAGKFNKCIGLILGDFSHSSHQDAIERLRYKEAVWSRVMEVTENDQVIIWGQFPSGHVSSNVTFPLGVKYEMNHERGHLVPLQ